MEDFPTAEQIRKIRDSSDYNSNSDIVLEKIKQQLLTNVVRYSENGITTIQVPCPTNYEVRREVIHKLHSLGYNAYVDLNRIIISW